MTENDKALVKRLRGKADWLDPEIDMIEEWEALDAADRIEALSAENERLMKLLKMVWKREVPEIGTLDWHYLMSIVEPNAALGDTFEDLGQDFEAVWDANRDRLYEDDTK